MGDTLLQSPAKTGVNMTKVTQPYIGVVEAARILKMSRQYVLKMAVAGRITSAYQVDGRKWIMLRSEIAQMAKEREK